MKYLRPLLPVLVSMLLLLAPSAQAQTTGGTIGNMVLFGPAPNLAGDRPILRVIGTSADTPDDTQVVQCQQGEPNYHGSPWADLDLTPYGVPSTAKDVLLTAQHVITKGNTNGTVQTDFFFRQPGSNYTGENIPCLGTGVQYSNEEVAYMANDGRRTFDESWVPLSNGHIQWSWGYYRNAGVWPTGDALQVSAYVLGYAN